MESLTAVTEQIKKFWAPQFEQELRENTLLPSLVNREYEGEIKQQGDTVYISQINAPTAELKTLGTDSDSFSAQALSESRVALQINKRIVAAYEFEDINQLLSQIGHENPEILQSLKFAVEKKLNDYLYTLVSPSTSSPDHVINSVTDFNLANGFEVIRKLAGQAKWPRNKPWYCLLDPVYYIDALGDTTLASADYRDDEQMVAGQIAKKIMGFNVLEDNSAGMLTSVSSGGAADACLAFYPDFMHLAMGPARFMISNKHSSKEFGYVLSVDMLCGAVLGNDGDNKHITVNGA